MFPGAKGCRIRLDIKMRVVQRVVCNPPEWIDIIAAGPQTVGTPLNCFSKHRESRVILAFQCAPKNFSGIGAFHCASFLLHMSLRIDEEDFISGRLRRPNRNIPVLTFWMTCSEA